MKSPRECGIPTSQHWLVGQLMMPGSAHPALAEKHLDFFLSFFFFLNNIRDPQTSTRTTSPAASLVASMISPLLLLLAAGLLHHTAGVTRMEKLADNKICGDAECSSKSERGYMVVSVWGLNPSKSPCFIERIICVRATQTMSIPMMVVPVLFCFVLPLRCPLCGHSLGWLHSSGLQIRQHQEGPDGLCVF